MGGVGDIVKELCEKVLEVGRVSDRVITCFVFEEDVLTLNCGYALQGGKILEEKPYFL